MKRLVLLAALVAVCCSCQKGGSADPLLGRWALEQEVPYYTAGKVTFAEVSAFADRHRARVLRLDEGGVGLLDGEPVTWSRKGDSLVTVVPPSLRRAYLVKSVSADRLVLRCGDSFSVVFTYARPLE